MMAFLDFSLAVENEGVLCAAIMISAVAEREGISLCQAGRQAGRGTETPKGVNRLWWTRTDPAPSDSALSVGRLERKREEKNDWLLDGRLDKFYYLNLTLHWRTIVYLWSLRA